MKKPFSILLTLPLFLAACSPADPLPSGISNETSVYMEDSHQYTEEPEGIEIAEILYYPEKPKAIGYLAQPKEKGDYPGIILIHEWWGPNQDMIEKANKFASQGYVALVVDLYEGKRAQTPDEAGILAEQVRESTDEAFNNLSAALDYLKNLDSVDPERLASVGWCFGGQWSYEMAKNDLGTDVSIMYYGRFHPEDDLEMMKASIIGHFGEDDASIAVDDVKQFQMTLREHSDKHEIYIYENAGHAFANEESDAYAEEAAKTAWQRSLEFLEKHL